MKRLLTTWVIIALLVYPSICVASYLIQLKNGKEFLVSEYWEEGNQVKFHYYGGLITIGKDQIQAIKESDQPYVEEVLETKAPQAPEIEAKEPAAETKVGAKEPSPEKKAGPEQEETEEERDDEYYKEQRVLLEAKIYEAIDRRMAARKKKDNKARDKARAEMWEIHDQLKELQLELKKKNNGVLPEWWPPI